MIIKVCGMRNPENIRAVDALDIDMMGFIFYPKSPRYVAETPAYLPQKAKRVGVFVNENMDNIIATSQSLPLDYIQLHGKETPEFCLKLQDKGFRIIKAFSIAQKEDVFQTEAYENKCNYFLFDTKCESFGGAGKTFDWQLLHAYNGQTPFLLSGGISPLYLKDLKDFKHPQMAGIDLNSGFETSPAYKNTETLKTFINNLKTTKI